MLPILAAAEGVCNVLVFSHVPLREISTPTELFNSEKAIQFVNSKSRLLFLYKKLLFWNRINEKMLEISYSLYECPEYKWAMLIWYCAAALRANSSLKQASIWSITKQKFKEEITIKNKHTDWSDLVVTATSLYNVLGYLEWGYFLYELSCFFVLP